MPIFEYRCQSCDHHFERLVRGAEVVTCPSCGSSSVERMISMFAVSSPGTQRRAWDDISDRKKQRSAAVGKEKEFYKTDHHDH